jgi:hypothetical protein
MVSGYEEAGAGRIAQTVNLLLNLGQISVVSLGLAALTLVLAVLLPRTSLWSSGRVVAIFIPSVLIALFSLSNVEIVRDVGEIPRGFPLPILPSTGISESVHNQMARTRKMRLSGPLQIYDATSIRGQSTRRAVADARTWLVNQGTEAASGDNEQ